MFESKDMLRLRRSAKAAGLCVLTCLALFAQGLGGAAQRPAAGTQAQLDVMVSVAGKPAPNATVIATEEGLQHVASVRTDAHGRAQFIVPPGRYRVSVSLDGHQGQVTVVRADRGSTSSVRLQVTASIHSRLCRRVQVS